MRLGELGAALLIRALRARKVLSAGFDPVALESDLVEGCGKGPPYGFSRVTAFSFRKSMLRSS